MTATQEKSGKYDHRGQEGREELLGRTLRDGEYLVKRVVGHGGMGKVYLATHTALSLPLALKQGRADQPLPEHVIAELDHILQGGDIPYRLPDGILPEQTFSSSGGMHTDRFLREALLLARLNHPAIPTLYDYFFENGYWYLAMDYIPGSTLNMYLRKHAPLPAMEALNYAMQLCDVLDYLHSQVPPIIFRDLKPSNIILTPEGTLMIVDFGIARYFRTGQVNDTTDFGSPGYASPEQYQCAGQTDGRSDLYSLGVILHEMLSGLRPVNSGATFDAPQHLDPGISSVLSGLVTLATRADPAHRFQSAHTFYLALERAYTIEERRSYQRQLVKKIEQGTEERKIEERGKEEQEGKKGKDPQEQQVAPQEGDNVAPSPQDGMVPLTPLRLPSPSLDLDKRKQMRAALRRARQERLEQENLEIQLASVDESLKRRSFLALSHTAHYTFVEPEKSHRPPLTTGQKVRQAIQISFLLALSLFLILASLLVYIRSLHSSAPFWIWSETQASTNNRSVANLTPSGTPDLLEEPWQVLPSLPSSEADNSSVYVRVQGRDYIYVSGGYRSSKNLPHYDRSLYRYDIDAAHWEIVTTSEIPGMINNAAVADEQGNIFFTAGYSTDTYMTTSQLYVYQPISGALRSISSPSRMPIGFGGAMLSDQPGHLYILQGFMTAGNPDAQAGTGWYRYDLESAQWQHLAPLPQGLGYGMLASDNNGGILLLGGARDAGQRHQTSAIYRYDIVHNTWTKMQATLPQPLSGATGCLINPDQFVVLGGYSAVHKNGLRHAWVFNPRTLHWQDLPVPPFGGSVFGAAACDAEGHIFVERGASDPQSPTRDFWELVLEKTDYAH